MKIRIYSQIFSGEIIHLLILHKIIKLRNSISCFRRIILLQLYIKYLMGYFPSLVVNLVLIIY